jgi:hypothetical protein
MDTATQQRVIATNPLIRVLTETGWVLARDSMVSGTYYLTNPLHDTVLYVHPPNNSLAITTIPVEVLS